MAKRLPAIGIDLGTTYCCVAVWRNGKAEIITNAQGNRTTASMVSFTSEKSLAGEPAEGLLIRNYGNTVFDVKRLIGRKFSDPMVQREMHLWPFRVVEGKGDKPMIAVEFKGEEKRFSSEDISSMILDSLRKSAAAFLDSDLVKDAVITVPAHFNNVQRIATKLAGAKAGLNVIQVISKPNAAAIAYGLDEVAADRMNKKRKIMVFDLGGGTCDVSIIDLDAGELNVVATAGDDHLGGEDITSRLVEHYLEEFERRHGSSRIRSNRKALGRLRKQCEEAKRALSTQIQASIDVDSLHEDIDYSSTISLAMFEELNADIFARCLVLVERCMQEAGARKEDIGSVILVGGSSRVRKAQDMMEGFFGSGKIRRSIHPDETIACGAATQASILSGESSLKMREMVVKDMISASLGIGIVVGLMSVIVPRNTPLPFRCERCFTTSYDDQEAIMFMVYEGEETLVKDNNVLGSITLVGLPRGRRQSIKIVVCFEISADGILLVTAEDPVTKRRSELAIKREDGWSGEEMADRAKEKQCSRERLESYMDDVQTLVGDDSMGLKHAERKMEDAMTAVRSWAQSSNWTVEMCAAKIAELEMTWSTVFAQSRASAGRRN